MAYRFKLSEPLSRGMRRVGLGQLELAARRIKEDPATAVHEVRKSLKRIRALLRLMRPALGDKVYRAENARFRDLGRLLSAHRDQAVMRSTLEKLEPHLPVDHRNAISALGACLVNEDAPDTAAADLRKVKLALNQAAKRFTRLKLQTDDLRALEDGLRLSYKAGRKALAQSLVDEHDDVFHDLRKAAQHHWRQMLLISNAWPEVCRARAAAAREVAQVLGDEHDFAVLATFAAAQRGRALTEGEADAVERCCRDCQQALRARAIPMAQRLFAERPGSFVHQFVVSWAAARELHRLEKREDQAQQQSAAGAPAYQG